MTQASIRKESLHVFDGLPIDGLEPEFSTTPWKQLLDRMGEGRWRERFEVKRALGEGAYGCVVEAYDRLHGTRVALKLLSD